MSLEVVILAAGKGTRMRSDKPKVLHILAANSLLGHVVGAAIELEPSNIHVVVGHKAEDVEAAFKAASINWVKQTQQLGTGHAVAQAMPSINNDATVLVLYGDVPLIKTSTLKAMLADVSCDQMSLLTVVLNKPDGYGRILRDENNSVAAIIEQKEATPEQLLLTETNTGIMAVSAQHLNTWLPALSNSNNQGEYYLTDIIAMAASEGVTVKAFHPQTEAEVQGVNDRMQLANLEREFQTEQANKLLIAGVSLRDPKRLDVRGELIVGSDVVIDINVVFEGNVRIGNNVTIGPNCVITDTVIADNVEIKANTVIENAVIADNCAIGPFARIRLGSNLAAGVKVGNFVETKKVNIGEGSKVSHLTYLGDANIGKDVNIGAGTITCNYDGVNKFVTEIADGVFIGSNSALVAPVSIGENATVGAGSVISKDIEKDQLAIARAKQRNLDGWQRPTKKQD
ncbi:MAG: bifunctional UDP-N-acetylglucosamine pyrophosphorylase/glucosamine-1-phosphate N-acetyltransferase [Pseudomonadales bacterium]|jgi:bifunctional UDP-N-acetylglucosamine pyrophosphorylase/glucosamine-1-phosphate N-acetyltransferase